MSVAGDIADAIKTTVTALSITGATVVRRKFPGLPQGKSPLEISVSVGEQGAIEPKSASEDFVTYPAAVAVVRAGEKKTGDDDEFRDILQSVRRAVNTREAFATVAEFDEVNVGRESPYDAAALRQADLNLGVELFSVRTIEPRG